MDTLKPPQTPQPLSSKFSKKIVLMAAGIGLLFMGIVGGWYMGRSSQTTENVQNTISPTPAQETQNDTTNWETYANEKYSISMQYPPQWSTYSKGQVFEQGDLFTARIVGDTQKEGTELYDGAFVAVALPMKINGGLQTWVKDYYTTHKADSSGQLDFSQETINGIAYEKVYTCGLGCFTYFHTIQNGLMYGIVTFAEGPHKLQYQNTIDKILSTFEFVDKHANSSASNDTIQTISYQKRGDWNIYTGAGFSIQFPKTYKLNSKFSTENDVIINSCATEEQLPTIFPSGLPSGTEDFCTSGMMINIRNDYDGSSRRQWYQKNFYQLVNPYVVEVNIAGINSLIMMDGSDNQGGTSTVALIPKGNKMYIVDFNGGWQPETGDISNLGFVKEVLSTFRLD